MLRQSGLPWITGLEHSLLAWSLYSRNINLRPTVEGEKPSSKLKGKSVTCKSNNALPRAGAESNLYLTWGDLDRLLKVALICSISIRNHVTWRMIWEGGQEHFLRLFDCVCRGFFLSQSRDGEFLVLGESLVPSPPVAANLWLCVGLRVTIWLRFRFICTKTHWRPGLMNINILNDKEKICFMGLQTGSVSVLLLQNHRKIAPISHTFGLPPLQSSNPNLRGSSPDKSILLGNLCQSFAELSAVLSSQPGFCVSNKQSNYTHSFFRVVMILLVFLPKDS